MCQVKEFSRSRWAGKRKAINKLPEKIILICPRRATRSEGRKRMREQESNCCSWSSRSPFDVMQSALTKCQHQAKEPKPKASPDSGLPACMPCAFKICQAVGLCVLFMLPSSIFVRLSFYEFFFFVGILKSRRCQANRQCPSLTFCGVSTAASRKQRAENNVPSYLEFRLCSDFPLHLSFII